MHLEKRVLQGKLMKWLDSLHLFHEEETGVEPSRSEIFIASRKRSDGSMICEEARLCAEKLKEVMNQNLRDQTSSNDAFAQVFGLEHPGRVRCIGRGLTPSKYFSSLDSTSCNVEIVEIKSELKSIVNKVDIVASALQAFIGIHMQPISGE
ncbi:unnamed protein product [Arabis nemorensis]|uniref:Uncharacterized protein n=1 Tax=Arabis nemorensis TaxID=586526 RepID=A0A565CHQ8_9BRAS|nr:unnamed protein product [Arabis nemorensis]